MTDYSISRGWGGKPWVTTDGQPLDWGDPEFPANKPFNAKLYNRISDLHEILDDTSNIAVWDMANACFGVAKDISLCEQFQALASEHPDPWNASKATKAEIKELLALAQVIGGSEEKAGRGSGFHRFAHLADEGQEIPFLPKRLEPFIDCYTEAMSRFKVIESERFVANDEICAAGSFDRLMVDTHDGECYIGDIKTGFYDARYCMGPTVQVATYANSEYYDQQSGKRSDIGCNLKRGLLIHVPLRAERPECNIYPLDLQWGWALAKQTPGIQAARKMRCLKRDRLLP